MIPGEKKFFCLEVLNHLSSSLQIYPVQQKKELLQMHVSVTSRVSKNATNYLAFKVLMQYIKYLVLDKSICFFNWYANLFLEFQVFLYALSTS